MYVKRRYGFWMTLNWSKWPLIYGTLYGLIVCLLAHFLHRSFSLPWGPLGVIGIAVAFYLGFKNNSSYDRTWEARKIWGSIVNNSRSFGAAVMAFVQGKEEASIKRELIYRHLAWLTALRYQLRVSKEWEHTENRINGLYAPEVCEDVDANIDAAIQQLLPQNELNLIAGKTNKASQILKIQAVRLQELRDQEVFEDFRHMEFHHLLTNFYADQGKSERIKSFPFPRQYASVAIWITIVFAAFIPFGLLDIIQEREDWMLWLCPFLSGLITWVFFLMEKIGDYSENPFEGTYNDVPITSIARTIEIDLREMLEEENIPEAIKDINGFLL